MKDTQGNPITEEDFMKDIGHGVVKQDWKEKLKEELYQFDVSSVQVTVLEYFIESLLSEARSDSYTNGYRDGYDEGRNAFLKEAIALSDLIESQNITVFDEWRAFKQFRNTLRDKLKHD